MDKETKPTSNVNHPISNVHKVGFSGFKKSRFFKN
jgi:hypothetical protein